ncbi:MAG: CBS domain-containing protein [Gammaproteobacteria bacterium]|nr:CBS domain-containing protein [Gammaproteobacteria bacterium]
MRLSELPRNREGGIIQISDTDSILNAATIMTESKIGALLVQNEEGAIVGILSERDIVRGMRGHSADLNGIAVKELMTKMLIRCSPDDTVNSALGMMTNRRIRHLPVFDGDELVGFVSIGDLVKSKIEEVQAEAEAMRQYIAS